MQIAANSITNKSVYSMLCCTCRQDVKEVERRKLAGLINAWTFSQRKNAGNGPKAYSLDLQVCVPMSICLPLCNVNILLDTWHSVKCRIIVACDLVPIFENVIVATRTGIQALSCANQYAGRSHGLLANE